MNILKINTESGGDTVFSGFTKTNVVIDNLITGGTLNGTILSLNKLDGTQINVNGFISATASGVTSVNGITTQIQFFQTGTTGIDFNIVSSGDTHSFNFPIASSGSTGKLNSSDWTTFNNKLDKTAFDIYSANTVTKFTADIPVILSGGKTLGKYTNGQTIPAIGKTAQEVLLDIAQEFISPSIGFNIVSDTIKEKGVSVTSVIINYNTSPNSAIISLRKIMKNGVIINNPVINNGGFTHNSQNIIFSDSVGDRTYSYQVDYTNFGTQTNNGVINFYAPSFFGVGSSNLLSAVTTMVGLETALPSSKELRTSRSRGATIFNPVNNRYFFVYPASFGNLASIIDQNGFNITAGFTLSTQVILLADGITNENYNIYISNTNTTQTNFSITFN